MSRSLRVSLIALTLIAASGCAIDDQPLDTKDSASEASPELTVAQLGSADSANSPYQGEIAWCNLEIHDLSRSLPYHFWGFEGECSDVFIDLANRDGADTFLLLYANYGSGWELIDWNDDCYSGTYNSCLELQTEAGVEYLVGATSYAYMYRGRRPAMSYHLTVSCRDAAGECFDPTAVEPQACGSRGLEPCADGYYCNWDVTESASACGANDAPGVCEPLPDACPRVLMPVCGCDGTTYTNDCYAAMNGGVDVAYDGSCVGDPRGEGEACGGFAGFLCDDSLGLVCDFSAHDFSETGVCGADYMGVCVVDEDFFCPMVWAPACGCDGYTYGNDCVRRTNYVALAHLGECEE